MSETLERPGAPVDLRERVDGLNARARELVLVDLPGALETAGEAARLASGAYPEGRAHALRTLGDAMHRLARREEAEAALEEALRVFRELRDRGGEAAALVTLAHVAHTTADFPRALVTYSQGLALAREAGDRLCESNALNGIALVHYALCDYRAAVELLLESLELKRAIGDRRTEAGSLNNLGLVYQAMGGYARAAELHEQALEIKRELGDLQGEANALANLGHDHHRLGDDDRARVLHLEALAVARRIGNRQTEAGCLENLGIATEGLGELWEALTLYEESLALQRELGNRLGEVGALVLVGRLRGRLGESARALEELRLAAESAATIGARSGLVEAHDALSEAYERVGELGRALEHAQEASKLQRALHREQIERSTAALLAGFTVEKAVREAELERVRSGELATANEALRRADAEKSVLLERLQVQAAELRRLAREDALTGLHNRRHLEDCLEREFARARRYGLPLTVAYVDVDHFKAVNDRFGHRVGDAALREVARLLREGSRTVDLVARFGGEEFVLAFPETPLEEAREACERLREAIEGHDWEALHPGLEVTVSVGVALAPDAASYERLIAEADERLFEAKAAGRNSVVG